MVVRQLAGNTASPDVAACSRPLARPKVHLPDWPELVTRACCGISAPPSYLGGMTGILLP
jgi:hypothetical protein